MTEFLQLSVPAVKNNGPATPSGLNRCRPVGHVVQVTTVEA